MDFDHQLNVHVSIQKEFSFPPVIKCSGCCSQGKFHCPFCLPAFFKPIIQHSRIKNHLEDHLRSAFYIGEYTIHRCALDCRSLPHYHCLYCTATLIGKTDFSNHVPSCRQAQMQKLQSSESPNSSTAALLAFDGCLSYGIGSSDDSDDSDSTHSEDQESNSSELQTPIKSKACDSVWKIEEMGSTETVSSNSDQSVQTNTEKPQDCDEYYFMSLVKMFKRLSPQKKTEVRMKIERLLFEAEFN